MASAKVEFDNRTPRKSGLYPIIIRIDHKTKWAPIKTGATCSLDQWDKDTLKIKKSKDYPNWARVNSNISETLAYAEKYIADNNSRIQHLSCNELRDEIKEYIRKEQNPGVQKKSGTVSEYLDLIIKDLELANRTKYAEVFENTKSSLNRYSPKIGFDRITYIFLNNYQNWCLSNGMTYGGISVYMRTLRRCYRLAIKDGLASKENYPFEDFKIKKVKTKKRAIKKAPIDAMRELELKKGSPIWHHWNYFRFYFNARGMNLIDVAFLRVKDVREGRLIYVRKKSNRPYSIALTSEMKEILGYYVEGKKEDDLIFPLIEDIIDSEDKNYIRKTYQNRYGDHIKYLNKMAELAGIKTHITAYTIRHSFATGIRNIGAPSSIIKDSLGQGNLGVTEVYLAETEDDVLDEWSERFLDSK